jgi:hypothetical protein
LGQGNGSASREPTYHGLESDNLHTGEHLPAHWRAPGPSIILYIVINIMLPIEEKKLAYKHPKLAEITSKQAAKFFLHPKIEMLWVEKAAQLGLPALMVGILLHFRSVWSSRESVTLPKELLDKFHISRGVKQWALKSLEEAGLISVFRETGRSPLITLRKV